MTTFLLGSQMAFPLSLWRESRQALVSLLIRTLILLDQANPNYFL